MTNGAATGLAVGGIPDTIYLDYAATTPCDPRVFAKMAPFFSQFYGNAHSKNHAYGWASDEAVDIARMHLADFFGVDDREIIFTSGATESNTLALRGVMEQQRVSGRTHLITSQIEHKSVRSCCRQLEEEGVKVTYLPVDEAGVVDVNALADAISDQTGLVSIMAVNNETGAIQPMQEIADLCAAHGVLFHSDLTQALGRIEMRIQQWNLALASFSSHKIYGPKGVGGLFVRRRPRVRLRVQVPGGGQEYGLRGGTLPVPLCVGFGEACRILREEADSELPRIATLHNILVDGILEGVPFAHLNGDRLRKVPHITNIAFPYVEGESLIMQLGNVCVSTGSACSSTQLEPSYVLQAMRADDFAIQSSLRFSIGRFTTQAEIEAVIPKVIAAVERLRALSPLWDMKKAGVDFSTIQWS